MLPQLENAALASKVTTGLSHTMDHTNFDSRFKCSNAPAAGHDWLFRGEKREPAMCTHRSPVQSQWLIWTAGKARPRTDESHGPWRRSHRSSAPVAIAFVAYGAHRASRHTRFRKPFLSAGWPSSSANINLVRDSPAVGGSIPSDGPV